jgi:hypothetical protein
MGSPYVFSILIAQWLGIAALVIGGISLAMAIFGKHKGHRFAEGLSVRQWVLSFPIPIPRRVLVSKYAHVTQRPKSHSTGCQLRWHPRR